MVLVVDFGSQYTGLLVKILNSKAIHLKVLNPEQYLLFIQNDKSQIKAVIFSGSPNTASIKDAHYYKDLYDNDIPTLGICFGYQVIARFLGANVEKQVSREYGKTLIQIKNKDETVFKNINQSLNVWMSHGSSISSLPDVLEVLAEGSEGAVAYRVKNKKTYALLFHPEVNHSDFGQEILFNFLEIANILFDKNSNYEGFDRIKLNLESELKSVKEIYCAVSGGVDSTVMAVLLSQFTKVKAIYIDHGFQRSYDLDDLQKVFSHYSNIDLEIVKARDLFMSNLKGISDANQKRLSIGKSFIQVFEKITAQFDIEFFGQGTIASDVIESGMNLGQNANMIKAHHNVGALPEGIKWKFIEPLKTLFKDEVRQFGRLLKIEEEFLNRHPFPGPGLAIRCLGEVNEEKIDLIRKADEILIHELKSRNLYNNIWQAGVVLIDATSTAVMGDEKNSGKCLVLRLVNSVDGMTAESSQLPWEDLLSISTKILNHVKGLTRVVYDLSSKPPATIEWE